MFVIFFLPPTARTNHPGQVSSGGFWRGGAAPSFPVTSSLSKRIEELFGNGHHFGSPFPVTSSIPDKSEEATENGDYLSYALFLIKQSVKQVIMCFFPGNYLSRALFLIKQSVKQVILCFFPGNYLSRALFRSKQVAKWGISNWSEQITKQIICQVVLVPLLSYKSNLELI